MKTADGEQDVSEHKFLDAIVVMVAKQNACCANGGISLAVIKY
jgi:hypothetical protein